MATHVNTKGAVRAYWVAIIIFVSAFMQGYDAGVAGGVLTLSSFMKDFNYGDTKVVNALTVGLEQAGAFVACPLIYPFADRYGRRFAIAMSAVVFTIGAILQTINTGSLVAWYIARIIAGFGMGGFTVVTPTFSAEMAPRQIRGRMGSMYQMMYTVGIFTAYWINYGVDHHIASISRQWQIPIGMQIAWGSILFLGMLTLPDTPRWFLTKNREAEAWKSLSWVRADSSEITQQEFEEIKQGLAEENEARAGFKPSELLEPINLRRLTISCLLFLFQQGTGSGAIASFSPQFFGLLVGTGPTDLLLTALFGAVKMVACFIFIVFFAERFGRRFFFIFGSLAMFSCMLPTALVLKFRPPPKAVVGSAVTPPISSAGIATIALLYINIAIYNWSWGPLPWAYTPEIFPTRVRAVGMALSVATHWGFSVCFAISTPYMIDNIGWGTFLFFAIFDMVNAIGSYFLVKETRGKRLEGLDKEFKSAIIDHENIEVEAAPPHPTLHHRHHKSADVDAHSKESSADADSK